MVHTVYYCLPAMGRRKLSSWWSASRLHLLQFTLEFSLHAIKKMCLTVHVNFLHIKVFKLTNKRKYSFLRSKRLLDLFSPVFAFLSLDQDYIVVH